MRTRVVRRVETQVTEDYDYEGNLLESEVEVEMIYLLKGSEVVWKGTKGEAHYDMSATSEWLPPTCLPLMPCTRSDAVWSFIADFADRIDAEHTHSTYRMLSPITHWGEGRVVDCVPGRTEKQVVVFTWGNGTQDQPAPDSAEWLLLVGEEHRTLVQNCYFNGSGYSVVGEMFVERNGST